MQNVDQTEEADLGPSLRHFRALVNALPVMVCAGRADGSGLECVSQPFLDYTGLETAQLLGWRWVYTVHPDDRTRLMECSASIVTLDKAAETEMRLRRGDGIYRWFLFRGAPQHDASGAVVGWCAVNTDIEHQRRSFDSPPGIVPTNTSEEDALRARQREYRSIIDSMPGLVAVFTPEGQTEFVNEQVLAYFGTGLAEIQRWQQNEVVHPDDRLRVATAWKHSVATGEPFESEHRLRRSDGVYRWFQVRAVPDRDPDGHIIRWPVLITDVDARRLADDELRRSEAFLIEVQRLSRTGGFRFDLATGQVESSTEIERAYVVQPGDDLSSPEFWFGRIHPDDRARVRSAFERCVRLRTDYRADYRVIRGDGTVGYQHAVGRPVLNAAGDLVEFIGASMDMTDQWLAAQELARASQTVNDMHRKLSHASQIATVGELAAAVAHEVNQPLAAVVANGGACFRWLSSTPPNIEKAVEAAERIVKDGKDAGEVVRRVRSLFKRAPIEDVTLNINDVIRDVLRLVEADIAKRRVAVATILEPDLPATRGDRVQLQQLFWNLTVNALDAVTTVSDRAKQVSVQSRRSGTEAIVEVTDNGVGIPNFDAVFEPFFTTKANGMGMGLTICRSIASAHRGRLSAARNPEGGTTFSFVMPLSPEALP